jgi:hypothetical protein
MVKPNPIFHKRIFWDVDFDKLDYDEKAAFVIERVFERGDVDDIRQSRRYYGDEKVTEVLLNADYMYPRILSLASAVTGKEITQFKCYSLRFSDPDYYLIRRINEYREFPKYKFFIHHGS